MVDVRTSLGTLHLEMTLANDTTAIFAITSAQVNEDLEAPVFFLKGRTGENNTNAWRVGLKEDAT